MPPFSAPGAPALRALCEAAAADEGKTKGSRSEAARKCHLETIHYATDGLDILYNIYM